MPENRYDDQEFFEQYKTMPRSVQGLAAAGEWHALRRLLPDLKGKRVLDLGCGFGWHCRYAVEQGAAAVTGLDVSENMLSEARRLSAGMPITYIREELEKASFPAGGFDVALSSLVFHYLELFPPMAEQVWNWLAPGGCFIFSVEHPVFTAYGNQDWYYDAQGRRLHWPVDRYFSESVRKAVFLGKPIRKYHKTLTTYVSGLLQAGFALTALVEPEPDPTLMDSTPEMRDELRRPMMLLLAARKPDREK